MYLSFWIKPWTQGWDSAPGIQHCMKGIGREHLLPVLLVPAVRMAGSGKVFEPEFL